MEIEITVVPGDITECDADAIVNAANNHLWMGSGVAGAIKRKGGIEIEKDAMRKGPINVGDAVESIAGTLPYKYIIHAAGMGSDLTTNEEIVGRVTANALLLADRLALNSLAFPAIGTGVGGLDAASCARAMLNAVDRVKSNLHRLRKVIFVLYDRNTLTAFQNEFRHGT